MKNILVFFCCILFLEDTKAQGPASFYLNENSGGSFHFTSDNIYISTSGTTQKLIKTDYRGNIIWTKESVLFPQAFDEHFFYSINATNNYTEFSIVKSDTSGNIIWAKDVTPSVCPLSNGNENRTGSLVLNGDRIYISSLQYNSSMNIGEYSALLTLDTAGNFINSWCNQNNFGPDLVKGYHSKAGGGWYITNFPGLGTEEAISKMNSDGNLDTNAYGNVLNIGISIHTQEIIEMPDSSYLVYSNTDPGGTGSTNPADYFISLIKLRENGTVIWDETIKAQPISDTAYSVFSASCDSTGNIYLIGMLSIGFTLNGGIITIKLDSNGNILFAKMWLNNSLGISIQNMHFKNNHICCGVVYHSGTVYHPGVLVFDTLFNACNLIDTPITIYTTPEPPNIGFQSLNLTTLYTVINDTVNITAGLSPISNDLCLGLTIQKNKFDADVEIAPNPFANKISIHHVDHKKIFIAIFTLTGEKLFEKEFSQPNPEIDLQNLPAGVYILNIKSESTSLNRKIIKM